MNDVTLLKMSIMMSFQTESKYALSNDPVCRKKLHS